MTNNWHDCMNRVSNACKKDGPIVFMLSQLKKLGCEISLEQKNLICEPCKSEYLGGFDPERKEVKVILCENNATTKGLINQVLSHELIHAYDVCYVNYNIHNIKHLACSEIRASNLSGECSYWKEFFNLSLRFKAHQQTCVKRQAVKSIILTKKVTKEYAEEIVNEVFDDCFYDTSPFMHIAR